MEGIILGVSLRDYTSELKIGDLVCVDEEYDEFSVIVDIDPRIMKNVGESDNESKYILLSKINNNKINYSREEISKASLAFFNSELYYNHNKKIKVGDISKEDIRNIKFKAILDYNLEIADINKITIDYLIGLTFNGYIDKKINQSELNFVEHCEYFKIKHSDLTL